MLTFTPDLLLKIAHHLDSDVAENFEIDPDELETIAESINEDNEIQGMIEDLL